MANSFEVQGGCKLSGEITPQGAKNEALQILSAVLLTEEKVTISNIPAESTVRLLDMTGKVLFSTAANSTLSMDLTDIKAGVYLLSIEGKKGSKTQKLVVRK